MMDLSVMGVDMSIYGTLDGVVSSIVWSERYNELGDFVLRGKYSDFLVLHAADTFIVSDDTDRVMVIEKTEIKQAKGEIQVTASGRSAESLLDRRIVWAQTTLSGNFQDAIESLLLANGFNTPDLDISRTLDCVVFEPTDDERITSLELQPVQFFGENLYDVVRDLCVAADVGFKMTLNSDNKLAFKLYVGTDRSEAQLPNPHVTFVGTNENLLSVTYSRNIKPYKNAALIAGEGQGTDRLTSSVLKSIGFGLPPLYYGLSRREVFINGSSISKKTDSGTLTDLQYLELLATKATIDLEAKEDEETFDGSISIEKTYTYGTDFNLGDIVQVDDGLGHSKSVRVSEMIRSEDGKQIQFYPTFTYKEG